MTTLSLPLNPLLAASYLVAALFEIVLPFLLGLWLVRRFKLRWLVFFYGMVVFALAQLFTRVPVVQAIQALYGKQIQADPLLLWIWLSGLVITAGLFEEVGRWLGYKFFFKREPRTWANALLYGAGHGGLESALLIGLSVLLGGLFSYLLIVSNPQAVLGSLPAETQQQVLEQYRAAAGWEPLVGALERLLSLAFHIGASVLVLQVFRRNNLWWLGLAIFWHMLTNGGAVAIQQLSGLTGTAGLLAVEGWVAVCALISLGIIFYFRPREPEAGVEAPLVPLVPAGEVEAPVPQPQS